MFQNRLFNMALIIIVAITLLGVVTFVLWQTYLAPASSEESHAQQVETLTAEELEAYTVDTGEITTNLFTNNYIVVRFSITADSEEAKEELEKRMPEVSQIIIKTFADLTPEDIKGSQGWNKLEARIMNEISSLMQEGKIVKVITTKKVLS